MFGLGLILLIAPEMLSRLWVGASLLVGALLIALALTLVEKQRLRPRLD